VLAVRGRIPSQVAPILNGAHRRVCSGVHGAVHHFRHAILQDLLADRVPPRNSIVSLTWTFRLHG